MAYVCFGFFLPQPLHFSTSPGAYICQALVNHPSYEFRINFPFYNVKKQKRYSCMDENWTNSMCTCDDVDSREWDSDANSITEMQISHFCLSKYLYKFVFFFSTMMYVCVCKMCMDSSSGNFEISIRSVWRFCIPTSFLLLLVDQSVFHSAWIISVGQAVNYDFSITAHQLFANQ